MEIADKIFLVVISALISSLLTVAIVWLNSLHKKQEKQSDNLVTLKDNLPREYVRKEDFKDWAKDVSDKINKLFNMVEGLLEGKNADAKK